MAEPARRLDWVSALRIAFGGGAALLLLACLLGIAFTGPIVVRVPPFDPRVATSPERLRESVERLCGELAPRDFRHPENLDRVADWIAAEFRAAGLRVEFQAYELPEGRFRNVIGLQPGYDPSVGALIVGAHYDAVEGSPGADDNASGVAALIELARTLPQPRVRGDRYFVAFATEEPPFFGTDGMGSQRFARALVERGASVELMLSLDMVGYYSSAAGSQRLPSAALAPLYPDRGDFVAVVGDHHAGTWIKQVKVALIAADKIPVFSFRAPPALAAVQQSDHLSFRRVGLPGVQLTDTAFYRNPHYHAAGDRPETLDYERLAALVQALHGLLWDPEAPAAGEATAEPR